MYYISLNKTALVVVSENGCEDEANVLDHPGAHIVQVTVKSANAIKIKYIQS
jgi:hypothetical protein